jgi:hypothetical protein
LVAKALPLLKAVMPAEKVGEWYLTNLAKFAEVVEASRISDIFVFSDAKE